MNNNDVKQVLVWRADIRNSKGEKVKTGKICAQIAHASLAVVLDAMRQDKNNFKFKIEPNSPWDKWLNGRFTKICVYCNSEEQLIDIYNQAQKAGIPSVLITDAGLTEFNGVPTKTCVGIGPYWSEEIDKITGNLSLL